jgi:hypothetical protein
MPRKAKRKTLSGVPGAPPTPPVDVPYGEGERALESQRRTPVPDYSATAAEGAPPAGAGSAVPGAPAGGLEMALQAAQGMAPPTNLLTAPTARPNEPLTAGLPIGPGPGPEVLASGDRTVRTLRMLADVTADAGFSQLAELAARQQRR